MDKKNNFDLRVIIIPVILFIITQLIFKEWFISTIVGIYSLLLFRIIFNKKYSKSTKVYSSISLTFFYLALLIVMFLLFLFIKPSFFTDILYQFTGNEFEDVYKDITDLYFKTNPLIFLGIITILFVFLLEGLLFFKKTRQSKNTKSK